MSRQTDYREQPGGERNGSILIDRFGSVDGIILQVLMPVPARPA
jgi:hypothetical protein